MTPLHEGAALFITTSVSISVLFLLTKPSWSLSHRYKDQGKTRWGWQALSAADWQQENWVLEVGREIKITPPQKSQACCFTSWLFDGSGSGARCAMHSEVNWITYTCENAQLSKICMSPTFWSNVPSPSPSFPIWDSISCCVDFCYPENGSIAQFFRFALNKLITGNDPF